MCTLCSRVSLRSKCLDPRPTDFVSDIFFIRPQMFETNSQQSFYSFWGAADQETTKKYGFYRLLSIQPSVHVSLAMRILRGQIVPQLIYLREYKMVVIIWCDYLPEPIYIRCDDDGESLLCIFALCALVCLRMARSTAWNERAVRCSAEKRHVIKYL